ncbi:MAG: SDR family oxidoreductase [Puia sp.]
MVQKRGAVEFSQWVLESAVDTDILINNAGIFEPGRVIDEPEGQMEKIMNTNFFSAYHVTRMLLPSMMARKSGHIFNMSSIAALQAYPNGGFLQRQQICSDRLLKKPA